MDVLSLTFAALIIIILIIVCTIVLRYLSGTERKKADAQEEVVQRPPIRRAGVRNARFRMHMNNQLNEEDAGAVEDENNDAVNKSELPDCKIGTKKRAKLAAKAEKKLQREAVERDREERKKQEQLLQERRDKQAEKEQAEKLRAEEAEKKLREEKEKKDYEEYLKMKESFSIEEEGCEEESEKNGQNLLQEFIKYIKQNKVLILEDLGAHFGLKTSSVVERIQELQANGTLTGVIDDRGKFIYISENELSTVAKFVRQRGRVTIAELAENSNNLINLASEKNLVSVS